MTMEKPKFHEFTREEALARWEAGKKLLADSGKLLDTVLLSEASITDRVIEMSKAENKECLAVTFLIMVLNLEDGLKRQGINPSFREILFGKVADYVQHNETVFLNDLLDKVMAENNKMTETVMKKLGVIKNDPHKPTDRSNKAEKQEQGRARVDHEHP